MHSRQSWPTKEFEVLLIKVLIGWGWGKLDSVSLADGSLGELSLRNGGGNGTAIGESLGLGFEKKLSFNEVLTSLKGTSVVDGFKGRGECDLGWTILGSFTRGDKEEEEKVGRERGELLMTFKLTLFSGDAGSGPCMAGGNWRFGEFSDNDDGRCLLTISPLLKDTRTSEPLEIWLDRGDKGCPTSVGRGASSTSLSDGFSGPINRDALVSRKELVFSEEILFGTSGLP